MNYHSIFKGRMIITSGLITSEPKLVLTVNISQWGSNFSMICQSEQTKLKLSHVGISRPELNFV